MTFKNGKVEFCKIEQMHLDVSESTANVSYVIKEVRQRWGEDYDLVTIDGLLLEDCKGAQGN